MKSLLTLVLVALSAYRAAAILPEFQEYYDAPEDVYGYEFINMTTGPGYQVHLLRTTSLTYLDDTVTTAPVWWHWQVVVIPDEPIYTDRGIIYVSSGNNDDPAPTASTTSVRDMITMAMKTGAVTSVLEMVPNQPINFVHENYTHPRIEDGIIAESWMLFIEENVTDPSVIALFPMTKAGKAGIDTMIDYAATVNPVYQINQIMPTGFSKRGWVSWLLGCLDSRVFAIAPTVFDLLKFYENLIHHNRAMGGWSWAFGLYWLADVPKYLHHPRTKIIGEYIDPLEYVDIIGPKPKFLHGGSGDQFFFADDVHIWWDEMEGEMLYMLFENDDHGLGSHRAILWENIGNFFIDITDGYARPDYSFNRQTSFDEGSITLYAGERPNWVRAWMADTTNRTHEVDDEGGPTMCRRDFRRERFEEPVETGILWVSQDITDTEDIVDGITYKYEVVYPRRPDLGYRTFHVEAQFNSKNPRHPTDVYHVSTMVNIIDDVYSFPMCESQDECTGWLK